MVRAVGGDRIETLLVLDPGVSPHTFEASPSKIKEMQGVKAFFVIGAGLDSWVENLANVMPDPKMIDMDEHVSLKSFEHQEDGHEHEDEEGHEHEDEYEHEDEEGHEHEHDHGAFDPHYWLDPEIAESMLSSIADELSDLDPENKEYFVQSAANYAEEIKNKDKEWQAKLAELENKNIVVFHDAWGYFADHFGLTIAASFEPFPGKTPSPSYLAELQEEVKNLEIKTMFVEPQFSAAAVETLASDLNVIVDVLDPLGGVEGRLSYVELIEYNVNTIYRNIK